MCTGGLPTTTKTRHALQGLTCWVYPAIRRHMHMKLTLGFLFVLCKAQTSVAAVRAASMCRKHACLTELPIANVTQAASVCVQGGQILPQRSLWRTNHAAPALGREPCSGMERGKSQPVGARISNCTGCTTSFMGCSRRRSFWQAAARQPGWFAC